MPARELETISFASVTIIASILSCICACIHPFHTALRRTLKTRKAMLDEGMADWAMGEAFAFGSLLQDGNFVRLSGERLNSLLTTSALSIHSVLL